ncbi:hypothetical protein [Nocardia xishanensis]|uniref:hypothetical protein n=1 Tax=Nocardia xishanensis TaxID=238964 RepID=UPI000837A792|nr:hypothetical protein [Nocardia xishanensis]
MNLFERRTARQRRNPVGAEVDEIFGPSRKHIHERTEWVAVAKLDDRQAGDEPLVDLEARVVRLPAPVRDGRCP